MRIVVLFIMSPADFPASFVEEVPSRMFVWKVLAVAGKKTPQILTECFLWMYL